MQLRKRAASIPAPTPPNRRPRKSAPRPAPARPPPPPRPFNSVPLEVFLLICAQADWCTLVRASQVSRSWRSAILSDRRLWRELDGVDLTSEKELERVGVWAERGKGQLVALEAELGRSVQRIFDDDAVEEAVSCPHPECIIACWVRVLSKLVWCIASAVDAGAADSGAQD